MSTTPESNHPMNSHAPVAGRVLGGVILTVGVIFLLQNTLHINIIKQLWPVILIVLGLGIMLGSTRRR